jgi:hypothetical protein
MTTPFSLAQDAANVAYSMTLEQTGDKEQAARDYFVVMQAYHEAHRQYIVSPAVTLVTAAPLAEAQAAKFAAHVAGLSAETQEALEMTRRIWRETEPIQY